MVVGGFPHARGEFLLYKQIACWMAKEKKRWELSTRFRLKSFCNLKSVGQESFERSGLPRGSGLGLPLSYFKKEVRQTKVSTRF